MGDIECVIVFRLDVREEDIRRSIRVALLDFLSFSSLVGDPELAVGGGENGAAEHDDESKALLEQFQNVNFAHRISLLASLC